MPVHMRQLTRGKDKGKWVVEDDAGKRVGEPTTRANARRRVSGRNLGSMSAAERRQRGIPER